MCACVVGLFVCAFSKVLIVNIIFFKMLVTVAPLLWHVTRPGSSWFLSSILNVIGQEIKLRVTQVNSVSIHARAVYSCTFFCSYIYICVCVGCVFIVFLFFLTFFLLL